MAHCRYTTEIYKSIGKIEMVIHQVKDETRRAKLFRLLDEIVADVDNLVQERDTRDE